MKQITNYASAARFPELLTSLLSLVLNVASETFRKQHVVCSRVLRIYLTCPDTDHLATILGKLFDGIFMEKERFANLTFNV